MKNLNIFAIIVITASSFVMSSQAFALELKHINSIYEADANYCGDENVISFYDIKNINNEGTFLKDGNEIIITEPNVYQFRKIVHNAVGDWFGLNNIIVTGTYGVAMNGMIDRLGVRYKENGELEIGSCHSKENVEKLGVLIDDENKLVSIRQGFKIYMMSPIHRDGIYATTPVFVSIDQRNKKVGVFYIY